eukprot:scaffold177_cov334-Pavlova_lutheri.AAC.88
MKQGHTHRTGRLDAWESRKDNKPVGPTRRGPKNVATERNVSALQATNLHKWEDSGSACAKEHVMDIEYSSLTCETR